MIVVDLVFYMGKIHHDHGSAGFPAGERAYQPAGSGIPSV
jgi:hypothetical protein